MFIVKRHTRSTLFPYTTLFRSIIKVEIVPVDAGGFQVSAGLAGNDRGDAVAVRRSFREKLTIGVDVTYSRHDFGIARDRKSTRLNSSHLGISYAVFCFKENKSR